MKIGVVGVTSSLTLITRTDSEKTGALSFSSKIVIITSTVALCTVKNVVCVILCIHWIHNYVIDCNCACVGVHVCVWVFVCVRTNTKCKA